MSEKNIVRAEVHEVKIETIDKPGKYFGKKAGVVVCKVDNSYTDGMTGEVVERINLVPFDAWGKTADMAEDLTPGDKIVIKYSLDGSQGSNGRWFPKIRLGFFKYLKDQSPNAARQSDMVDQNQEAQGNVDEKDIPF